MGVRWVIQFSNDLNIYDKRSLFRHVWANDSWNGIIARKEKESGFHHMVSSLIYLPLRF